MGVDIYQTREVGGPIEYLSFSSHKRHYRLYLNREDPITYAI